MQGNESIMKILVLTGMLLSLLTHTVNAGMRVWTMKDGRSFEAELVSFMADSIVMKMPNGSVTQVKINLLADADIETAQLECPPALNINFKKKSTSRVFPESLSDLPDAYYYYLGVEIRKKEQRAYDYPLTVELFGIGKEANGKNYILLTNKKEEIQLTKENNFKIEMQCDRVQLTEYQVNGENRGEKYEGYLVVITDKRGKIIAHETSRDLFFDNVENLRQVPVTRHFNDQCIRVSPTRPRSFNK